MATFFNIRTGQTLTQAEFATLVCETDYTCCSQYENVWLGFGMAKNEYQWQLYFNANNLCSDGNKPINTVPPVISGGLLIGNVLTTTNGTWTSDTGVTGYSYQWYRNNVIIVGATNQTYTIVGADMDAFITCKVIATDSDGASLPATSNQILIPIYWGVVGGSSVWGAATNNIYA